MNETNAATASASEQSGGPRWRMIVGILGLVYGVLGTLMWLLATASTLFWKPLMKMSGMGDLEMPAVLFWQSVLSAAILAALGVLLATGAALLLARRPLGATLMRTWSVLRILMLVVGLGLGFAMLTPQVDFQMNIAEAQRDMLKQRGVAEKDLPAADRERTESWLRYSMGGMTVVLSAFPLFVGLVLTSRAKKDEIESWRFLPR